MIKIRIDDDTYDALPQEWREQGTLEIRIEDAVNGILFDAEVDTEVEVTVE